MSLGGRDGSTFIPSVRRAVPTPGSVPCVPYPLWFYPHVANRLPASSTCLQTRCPAGSLPLPCGALVRGGVTFFRAQQLLKSLLTGCGCDGRLQAHILMEFNIPRSPCLITILQHFIKVSLLGTVSCCCLGFTKCCVWGVRMLSGPKSGLRPAAWVQTPDLPLASSGNLGLVTERLKPHL